ncbi:MAG: hypothetical protein ACYDER_24955 [Ktedonobacteraceae bacterium]
MGKGSVAGDSDLVVAGATIHGAIILGQEWYLCFGATLGTDHRVHFARDTFRTSSHTVGRSAASRTAGGTTTGLIHQSFLLVEFLLACGKFEIVTAVAACESLIDEVQLETSL